MTDEQIDAAAHDLHSILALIEHLECAVARDLAHNMGKLVEIQLKIGDLIAEAICANTAA